MGPEFQEAALLAGFQDFRSALVERLKRVSESLKATPAGRSLSVSEISDVVIESEASHEPQEPEGMTLKEARRREQTPAGHKEPEHLLQAEVSLHTPPEDEEKILTIYSVAGDENDEFRLMHSGNRVHLEGAAGLNPVFYAGSLGSEFLERTVEAVTEEFLDLPGEKEAVRGLDFSQSHGQQIETPSVDELHAMFGVG